MRRRLESLQKYFLRVSLDQSINLTNLFIESNDSINIILNIRSEDVCITDNITNLIKYIENTLKVRVNVGLGRIYSDIKNISSSYLIDE